MGAVGAMGPAVDVGVHHFACRDGYKWRHQALEFWSLSPSTAQPFREANALELDRKTSCLGAMPVFITSFLLLSLKSSLVGWCDTESPEASTEPRNRQLIIDMAKGTWRSEIEICRLLARRSGIAIVMVPGAGKGVI